MKKLLFLLTSIILIFPSCEETPQSGTVEYQITSDSDFFHLYYDNEYDNLITEISNSNTWSKQVTRNKGDVVLLNFNEGGQTHGVTSGDGDVYVTMSISFNGNILNSYTGITDYETIMTELQ